MSRSFGKSFPQKIVLPRLCEAVAERYERTRQFRATTHAERAISRHQDCFQNTFELCTMNTAEMDPKKWTRFTYGIDPTIHV